jgi:hypothetical protein
MRAQRGFVKAWRARAVGSAKTYRLMPHLLQEARIETLKTQ